MSFYSFLISGVNEKRIYSYADSGKSKGLLFKNIHHPTDPNFDLNGRN